MDTVLTLVKNALGITGNYQDATLQVYIDEIKAYMTDAGVPESVITADSTAGVIARGVADIWDYGSGNGKLSSYFYQRVSQLSYQVTPPNGGGN